MIPEHIYLPTPPIGGKCWLLERKGLFVLERGPGTIRTMAITHAGSSALEVIDGIPDGRGFFADSNMEVPEPFTLDESQMLYDSVRKKVDLPAALEEKRQQHIDWGARDGRPFYRANPVVMGSWMLDGGFIHGLTISVSGAASAVNAFASIVWMPFKGKV